MNDEYTTNCDLPNGTPSLLLSIARKIKQNQIESRIHECESNESEGTLGLYSTSSGAIEVSQVS